MVTAVKSPAKSTRARTSTAARKRPLAQTTAPKPAAKHAAVKKAVTKAPVAKTKVVTTAPAAPAADKVKSPKKPKLVRDSFTMPKDEYAAIDLLKQRATGLKRHAKKSELIRAGIMALTAMDDKQLAAVMAQVPALKTGRPVRS